MDNSSEKSDFNDLGNEFLQHKNSLKAIYKEILCFKDLIKSRRNSSTGLEFGYVNERDYESW